MAALSALPLSMGLQDLEKRAERSDARHGHHAAQSNTAAAATSAEDGSSSSSLSPASSLPLNRRREYTVAFFGPRVIGVFVLGCMVPFIYIYLYVGALWNPPSHVHNVVVSIFNFDGGVNRSQVISDAQLNATGQAALSLLLPADNVGRLLADSLLYSTATANVFHWHYCDSSNCSHPSCSAVQSAVASGSNEAWYSICIPADYTQQLLAQSINVYSLTQLNTDVAQLVSDNALPDPLGGAYNNSILEIWDQGRSFPTFTYLATPLSTALTGLSSEMSRQLYANITRLPAGISLIKAAYLFSPVPVASINVHPVSHSGLNYFSYLSALVMWIGGIVTMTVVIKWSGAVERQFFGAATQSSYKLHASIGVGVRLLLIALINIIQAALIMSVIPALGGSDMTAYNYGDLFVWLWYCSFCMSLTIGGLVALVGPEIFQLFATLWLILQLTSSGGLIDLILQPGFYQIGVAFPLYHVTEGNRTILFGSYYKLEKDALVLFGWAVGSLVLIMLLATRRIDRLWDTLRDSALVDALRDTSGFSASKRHIDSEPATAADSKQQEAESSRKNEKQNGYTPTSNGQPDVEMQRPA